MKRILLVTSAVAVITMLAGCMPAGSSPSPASSSSPLAAPGPTPTVSIVPEPLPTPDTPVTSPSTPASDWTDMDLVGVCKVAWNDTGLGVDWSAYSPDAQIEERSGGWYIAISSDQGQPVRDCEVTGTPAAPSVTVDP